MLYTIFWHLGVLLGPSLCLLKLSTSQIAHLINKNIHIENQIHFQQYRVKIADPCSARDGTTLYLSVSALIKENCDCLTLVLLPAVRGSCKKNSTHPNIITSMTFRNGNNCYWQYSMHYNNIVSHTDNWYPHHHHPSVRLCNEWANYVLTFIFSFNLLAARHVLFYLFDM